MAQQQRYKQQKACKYCGQEIRYIKSIFSNFLGNTPVNVNDLSIHKCKRRES